MIVGLLGGCAKTPETPATPAEPSTPANTTEPSKPAEVVEDIKFPERGINMVIGYAAGGGTDLIGRILAKSAEAELGVPVTVINQVGGASVPSLTDLLNARPDGYTIQFTTPVPVQYHHISDDVNWSYKDFTTIMNVGSDPYVVTINANLPWENLQDLVDAAKSNPGTIKGAMVTPGVIWGDSVIAFVEGIDCYEEIVLVPNPSGTAGCITAVVGGHADFLCVSAGEVLDYVTAGQLKIIAVTGDERNGMFPDIPTAGEQGFDLFPVSNFRGLIAPPGMDPRIVEKLHNGFKAAMDSEEFTTYMKNYGMEKLYLAGDDYVDFLKTNDEWFGDFYSNAQFYKDLD